MSIEVQYASDLHLEFYPKEGFETFVKPVAPILVLAGDIGHLGKNRLLEFITWCSNQWTHVLWVFGNHEFYIPKAQKHWHLLPPDGKYTIEEKTAEAKAAYKHLTNVHILDRDRIEIEGHLFFGATLWSDVPAAIAAAHSHEIADFRCIAGERAPNGALIPLGHEFRQYLFQRDLTALNDFLSYATLSSKPFVVITHHLPTDEMVQEKYRGMPTNPFYSTALDPLLKTPGLVAWICGHSHGRRIIQHPGPCYLNARGYPGEQKNGGNGASAVATLNPQAQDV